MSRLARYSHYILFETSKIKHPCQISLEAPTTVATILNQTDLQIGHRKLCYDSLDFWCFWYRIGNFDWQRLSRMSWCPIHYSEHKPKLNVSNRHLFRTT